MSDRVLQTLRLMAWERAKAELMGVLHTYWNDDSYGSVSEKIEDFIKDLDDNELG